MTLLPTVIEPSIEFGLEAYEQAKAFQANLIWKKLDEITLEEAFSNWFSTLSHKTQINYKLECPILYHDILHRIPCQEKIQNIFSYFLSWFKSHSFRLIPPPYPPRFPLLLITRWQGITIAN